MFLASGQSKRIFHRLHWLLDLLKSAYIICTFDFVINSFYFRINDFLLFFALLFLLNYFCLIYFYFCKTLGDGAKEPPAPPSARSLDYLFALDTGCYFFGTYSVQSSPFSPPDNGGTDSPAEGFFITGLARFPRSCFATIQFLCKNFDMLI